jgi:Phosphotransferase enzyme family
VNAVTQMDRTIRIAESPERLLAGCERREPWKNADSLSGSRLERVVMDGVPMVVKYSSVDDDWIMRATGDLHGRQLTLLSSGVLDALPDSIDHGIVGCAPFTTSRGHRGVALLMRDLSDGFVPYGSEPIAIDLHRRFIHHMADLHATYWGFHDGAGLFPLAHHYVFLTPLMAELEAGAPRFDPVPLAVAKGWRQLDDRFPEEASRLRRLASDPWSLVDALRDGPQTLVHGDWKLGNLGSDGRRTILIDWDRTGEGPGLVDLAWYMAVNCDRLPETKEATIDAYRAALESAGVATASWWDAQLGAALAGAFLQLAWDKTEDALEFGWWSERLAAWNP